MNPKNKVNIVIPVSKEEHLRLLALKGTKMTWHDFLMGLFEDE